MLKKQTLSIIKICFAICLSTLLLSSFLFMIQAQAQTDEPIATHIVPESITNDELSEVSIFGSNFTIEPKIELILRTNPDEKKTIEIISFSQNEIKVLIPSGLPVGVYTLQVNFTDNNFIIPFRLEINYPDAKITSVSPSEFWNKNDVILEINGTGFNQFESLALGGQEISNTTIISNTLIHAIVPAGFDSGNLTLKLIFDGKPTVYDNLIIHQYSSPSINNERLIIYNNFQNSSLINGTGFLDASLVFVGGYEIIPQLLHEDSLVVPIPEDFEPGRYDLSIEFLHGERITNTKLIDVRPPISAEITSTKVTNLSDSEYQINIQGENVISTTNISLYTNNSSSPLQTGIAYNILEHGSVELSISKTLINDSNTSPNESYLLRLLFPDKTARESRIKIYRSLLPTSSIGNLWLFIMVAVIWAGSRRTYASLIKEKNKFLANKTAPKFNNIIGLILSTVSLTFIWGVLVYWFWGWLNINGISSGQLRYIITWLIIGIEISLVWQFTNWMGLFYEVWSTTTRFLIAATFSLIAILVPFILNNTQQIPFAPFIELVLVAITIGYGVFGYRLVHNSLAEQRRLGPSDEVILREVEAILFRDGEVSAEKDFPAYPRDRVKQALDKYVIRNRDLESFDYDPEKVTLLFSNREAIKSLSDKLKNIEIALKKPIVWHQEENINLIEDFMAVINSQMGFITGEDFGISLSEADKYYVSSLHSIELESVLPNPFPFYIYLSHSSISAKDIDLLKRLQNELNIPKRFAILFVLTQENQTEQAIQRSLITATARENIAVFGPNTWKKMLLSKKALHQTFMDVVQKQVDLTIFSPFQIKGPTNTDMYFGRSEEITKILESIHNNSIAILGARRIGKTSMLRKATQILSERGKFILYLDCYDINSYNKFFNSLKIEWKNLLINLDLATYKDIDDFAQLVADIDEHYPGNEIVFQFDEIDRLLRFDSEDSRDELLFRGFRALAQKGRCQFIFSGERMILEKLSDPQSGFFNFPIPISLNVMDLSDTEKLIMEPMTLIGVAVQNKEKIVYTIFNHTEGHPNLIQYICDQMLVDLRSKKTRTIDEKIVNSVLSKNSQFWSQYKEVFRSQSNSLEETITLMLCIYGPMSESEIIKTLRKWEFDINSKQVKLSLEYLILCQLFQFNQEKYEIKPGKYINLLVPDVKDDDFISDQIYEYRSKWHQTS